MYRWLGFSDNWQLMVLRVMSYYELEKESYEKIRPLLEGMDHNLILAAVIEGTTPGRVYADQRDRPTAAFVCSVEGYYLLGRPDRLEFNEALSGLILGQIFEGDTLRPGEDDLYLYYHPLEWEAQLAVLLPGRHPLKENRRHYLCRQVQLDWRAQIPDEAVMHQVDGTFLAMNDLANHALVTDWVATNWNSEAEFLERGFGFALVYEGQVASLSVADCASDSQCEIGIRTVPEFRRRGFGTLTAAAAVEHALEGIFDQIGWHCTEDNLGSIGVAEKVGFSLNRTYPVQLCFFDNGMQLAFNGLYARRADRMPEAMNWYRQALAAGYQGGWMFYEMGCLSARGGEVEEALAFLQQALENGWTDLDHMTQDPDLESLHGHPGWETLFKRVTT
jgi:RimJ/RimL family protein N-acetyltransferase